MNQLSELAYLVFIAHGLDAAAEELSSWVLAEPFTGDYRLRDPISGLLSLGRWLARAAGDQIKAHAYGAAISAPERLGDDEPGIRELEPNLYAPEILDAVSRGDKDSESRWRQGAVRSAVEAWAAGRTPGHPQSVLERFVAVQVQAVRGLK